MNTNLLLPNDVQSPGEVITITRLGRREAIQRLISQGYMPALVILARRCFANTEFFGRGKVICGTNITYSCPLRDSGVNSITSGQTLQVNSELMSGTTEFGRLLALIFEYGQQVFRRGQYRQRGIYNNCTGGDLL